MFVRRDSPPSRFCSCCSHPPAGLDPETGSYTWTVPDDLVARGDYAFYITDGESENYSLQFALTGTGVASTSAAPTTASSTATSSAEITSSATSEEASSTLTTTITSEVSSSAEASQSKQCDACPSNTLNANSSDSRVRVRVRLRHRFVDSHQRPRQQGRPSRLPCCPHLHPRRHGLLPLSTFITSLLERLHECMPIGERLSESSRSVIHLVRVTHNNGSELRSIIVYSTFDQATSTDRLSRLNALRIFLT